MLAIVNVSPEDTPIFGIHQYEVRINEKVIATFDHERKPDGAAQCLRDAADAVDRCRDHVREKVIEALLRMEK